MFVPAKNWHPAEGMWISILFYHYLLQLPFIKALADKQGCAPLMKIKWIWWDPVLLNKPKKSTCLPLHSGLWSPCRLSVCQPAGNKALWGRWVISRECPFCMGTLERGVVKSCCDYRLSQSSTPEIWREGCLMNWSGSWSLQGLVPGLQQAATEAPLGLLECGSNRNRALGVWLHAPNHLAAAVLLCLLQIGPETALERFNHC